MFSAGAREVFGLVLSYTLYYISQNPSAQDRLRSELRSANLCIHAPTTSGQSLALPSPFALDGLPYLSAVLKESFRMRPNSTPLPRITPSDGPVSLAGVHDIPPGTRVNSFQWFVHRDPSKWDQPDKWIPERHFHCQEKGKEAEIWAFGSGPRVCVGRNLTQYSTSLSPYPQVSLLGLHRITDPVSCK